MKVDKLVISGGLIVALGGYLGYEFISRRQAERTIAAETVADAVPVVSITKAVKTNPTTTMTLPGNIEAWYQAPIYAQVSGYVTAWYKDYGAELKKGDVLAHIDAPALSAQFEQAKADLAAQRAQYEISKLTATRYAAMSASNAVPKQSISVKEADALVQKAHLSAAEQHLKNVGAKMNFRTIVAPYDGVLISREINVGDYVNTDGDVGDGGKDGKALFTVADTHKMRLFVSVPESFGQLMRPGEKADVMVPQFPNRHYTAEFLTVAKGFRPETRTAVVEFTIDNEDRSLWPGSYATVTLSATSPEESLTVPATALVFDEQGTQVAVLDAEDRVHFVPVVLDKILDSEMVVNSGISVTDRIVDNPSAYLLEGDKVRVAEPAVGVNFSQKS